jgi:hypothetical protein
MGHGWVLQAAHRSICPLRRRCGSGNGRATAALHPAGAAGAAPEAAMEPRPTPVRQLLLTVWCPRPGEFVARALLPDGTLREFTSPFELVRFLARPEPPPPAAPGLR